MLTIWGTPQWANGGKGQNFAPTNMTDLQNFAQGARVPLLGPVQRLPVRPLLHGLERVEPRPVPLAAVRREGQAGGAGDLREALPRRLRRDQGRQLPLAGRRRRDLGPRPRPLPRQAGHAGDRVAGQVRRAALAAEAAAQVRRLVAPPVSDVDQREAARERPLAERDAGPDAAVRESSRQWFKQKNLPFWITEYGHETKPEEPKGVTYAQQAAYVKQAINYAARDPSVTIFIWFIVRDDPTSAWQSGLVQRDGAKKPAYCHASSPSRSRTTGGTRRSSSRAAPTNPVGQVRGARALVALRRRRQGRHDDRDLRPRQGAEDRPADVGDRRRRLGLVPGPAHDREGPRLPDHGRRGRPERQPRRPVDPAQGDW